MKRFALVACSALVIIASTAKAEPQLDIVAELMVFKQHYVAKQYGEAANKLTEVADVLRGYKAKELAVFLPEAPAGWSVVEDSETSGGMGFMGGGSLVNKTFTDGSNKVSVGIMSDNPMVKSLMGLAAAAGAGSMADAERYKGQMVKFDEAEADAEYMKENSLMVMFSDGKTVTVEGEGMSRETGTLFLDQMDIPALSIK